MTHKPLKLFLTTAIVTGALAIATPALAIPVLFGGQNISVEDGGSTSDIAAGSTVTVTGALLQLQLSDGSTITAPKGASFKIVGEGDNVTVELISGSMRVDSKGTPISVTRGDTTITTADGAFSAFGSQGGGLDGRVNAGTASVEAGGETRDFGKGEGYVASSDGVSGTFTPPPASSPQYASNTSATSYSSADERSADGNSVIADEAVENAGGDSGENPDGSVSYGGTPPITGVTVPVTGTEQAGHSILYAADVIGIDQRTDVTVTVDGGALTRYKVGAGADEDMERNSNSSLESGNANNEIFIERWAGGETHGNYYNAYNGTTYSELGRTSHQGFHLVYGEPSASLPATGIATYSLAAATSPTIDTGQFAPGTFTGDIAVLFGPTFKVGLNFTVDMPGDHVYTITTTGGAANPTAIASYTDFANGVFGLNNIAVAQGGAACPTTSCIAIVDGLFAGVDGNSLGIAYQIMDFSINPDINGRAKRISGAAAFTQASYDAGAGGGGGGSGGAEPANIESGSLDAPLRATTPNAHGGVAFMAPIKSFRREATISTDVVLDDDGAMTGFKSNSNGAGVWRLNDGVIADLAGTNYMQIGRWNGGSIQHDGATWVTVAGWQGSPYLVGIPLSNFLLPTTGIATYSLAAATAPIFASGTFAPGTFTGSAAVLFGASAGNSWKIGLDAEVTMTETSGVVVYNISTPGGIVDPSQSPITGIASYDITSPAGSSICVSATCHVDIRSAMLAGPEGRDLGLAYIIYNNSNDGIFGTALFQKIGNDDLFRQDIGLNGLVLSPGSVVMAGGYGMQAFLSSNAEVTYTDPAGGIEQVTSRGSSDIYAAGAADIVDKGTSGPLTWSRWTNGATAGAGAPGPVLGANQGVHLIAGTPGVNIPTTGSAQYTLAGYTAPTIADGSEAPGTFAGTMGVAFGTNSATARVGLDLDVTIGGHTYGIATTGGSATPSTSQIGLYTNSFGSAGGHPSAIDIATGGPACTGGTCKADVSGFLAGNGGSHAALAYTISSNGSPNIVNAVQGSAAFVQAP